MSNSSRPDGPRHHYAWRTRGSSIVVMRKLLTISIMSISAACAPAERSENSAICGITMLAGASRIIDQLTQVHSALTVPPVELEQGIVRARVVGYGTTAATTAAVEDGSVAVQYTGQGFPETPGFGVALVDDSSEVFHGILIWDKEPPPVDYPRIGTIADANIVMPLIGVRLNWASVYSERCPLFAELDSTSQ